jgi:hypothetical protein
MINLESIWGVGVYTTTVGKHDEIVNQVKGSIG